MLCTPKILYISYIICQIYCKVTWLSLDFNNELYNKNNWSNTIVLLTISNHLNEESSQLSAVGETTLYSHLTSYMTI